MSMFNFPGNQSSRSWSEFARNLMFLISFVHSSVVTAVVQFCVIVIGWRHNTYYPVCEMQCCFKILHTIGFLIMSIDTHSKSWLNLSPQSESEIQIQQMHGEQNEESITSLYLKIYMACCLITYGITIRSSVGVQLSHFSHKSSKSQHTYPHSTLCCHGMRGVRISMICYF